MSPRILISLNVKMQVNNSAQHDGTKTEKERRLIEKNFLVWILLVEVWKFLQMAAIILLAKSLKKNMFKISFIIYFCYLLTQNNKIIKLINWTENLSIELNLQYVKWSLKESLHLRIRYYFSVRRKIVEVL